MAAKKKNHLVEDLEAQFHSVHGKIVKAKDQYINTHKKEYDKAKKALETAKKKLASAKTRATKAAIAAKKSSSKAAHEQLKKAKAAAALVADSLHEAKGIYQDKEANLKAAKPFEKKLAERAKALAAFEKQWEKKQIAEAKMKTKRAAAAKKARKAKAKAAKLAM